MEKIVKALARIIMIMTLIVMTQGQIFADEDVTANAATADVGAVGSGDMSTGGVAEGSVVAEEPAEEPTEDPTEEPETPVEGDMVASAGTESPSTPSTEVPASN